MTNESSSRRVFLAIVLLLLASVIATAIFGWVVMQNVRETATRTDRDMRTVAWASIAWACEHDGRFPRNEQELLSMAPLPTSISCAPVGEESWPTTLSGALEGAEPPSLEEAYDRIEVYYSSDGMLPPVVEPGGLPMLLDTKETVVGWMSAFEIAAEGAPETPPSE